MYANPAGKHQLFGMKFPALAQTDKERDFIRL